MANIQIWAHILKARPAKLTQQNVFQRLLNEYSHHQGQRSIIRVIINGKMSMTMIIINVQGISQKHLFQ